MVGRAGADAAAADDHHFRRPHRHHSPDQEHLTGSYDPIRPVIGGGIVYALDAATGRRRWSFSTEKWIESPPAVAGDLVYVGSTDGEVYAIAAGSG